ncbi:MAG: hypothetical protein ACSLFF_06705 [Solirubrobacterales bacterium]
MFLYHPVAADPGPRIADFSLTPDDFRKHLDLIAASGRASCTFSEFASRLSAGPDLLQVTQNVLGRDSQIGI